VILLTTKRGIKEDNMHRNSFKKKCKRGFIKIKGSIGDVNVGMRYKITDPTDHKVLAEGVIRGK